MSLEHHEAEAWRAAVRARIGDRSPDSTEAAGSALARRPVPRRSLIRAGFFTGLGLAALTAVGGAVDYVWPRRVHGFGAPVAAGSIDDLPPPGTPRAVLEGQFWLVHLDPNDRSDSGAGGASGLLALWRRCPHLGCSVPWNERGHTPPGDFTSKRWFQCPCHGSTYTIAGVRVYGPAPRGMDTMRISIDGQGLITVHTGDITPGGEDNPQRAVPAIPGVAQLPQPHHSEA